MAKRKTKSSFYHADGKRIDLTRDAEVVAVDVVRFHDHSGDAQTMKFVELNGQPVGNGFVLLKRDQLTDAMYEHLQQPGITQPVFERDGIKVIALPELRVEVDSVAKLSKVVQFVINRTHPIRDDPSNGRLSISPLSDDGQDALDLANDIFKQFAPISVSPRFVQIVPGPTIRIPKK